MRGVFRLLAAALLPGWCAAPAAEFTVLPAPSGEGGGAAAALEGRRSYAGYAQGTTED